MARWLRAAPQSTARMKSRRLQIVGRPLRGVVEASHHAGPIPLRPRRARGRCRRRLLLLTGAHHAARAHHPAGIHHRTAIRLSTRIHLTAVITAMAVVVAAVVAAGPPAGEEPREEDHRDDEKDTGDDAYPRQDLTQPTGPVISVVIAGLPGHGGWFGSGFRCIRHVANDATHIPPEGRDYRP
jgi:hypothetical protein